MQVYQLVITVMDFEDLGADEVRKVVESVRYPNDCISPRVMSIESRDIGRWHDEHPLNQRATADAELRRLFEPKK